MTDHQKTLASDPEIALSYVKIYLEVMLDNKNLTSGKDYRMLIENLFEYMNWRRETNEHLRENG